MPFSIKRSDTLPILEATLMDSKKAPIDLTNATSVKFLWRLQSPTTSKVTQADCVIVDRALGQVEYQWAVNDTKVAGDYYGEFRIVFSNGDQLTVPSSGFAEFVIDAAL
jgi:hypothetical protein